MVEAQDDEPDVVTTRSTKTPLKPLVKRKDAVLRLFPKHYRLYPHEAAANTNQFCRLFSLGMYCIVLDVNFQPIGTFDVYLRQYYPGLTLVPPYLRKWTHKAMEERRYVISMS